MVICLERVVDDLHMVQLMPLPPVISCFGKNPDWFNLSGAGLLRLSWKRGCQVGLLSFVFILKTSAFIYLVTVVNYAYILLV